MHSHAGAWEREMGTRNKGTVNNFLDLFKDGEIMKILFIILGLIYVISPYDLIPDFLLGFGWLDDLTVIWILWQKFCGIRNQFNPFNYYTRQSDNSITIDESYAVLGLEQNAAPDEIKTAYRSLAKKYHPDKVRQLKAEDKKKAEIKFRQIQEAYDNLKNLN